MSKRTDRNQVFDTNGNLVSEEVVEVITYISPEESLILAARLVVLPKLTANELTDEQVEQLTGLFPDWTADGVDVKVGEVYRYDGTLVEVVQGHKPQADWPPDKVPALFKIHRTAAVEPWKQPTGGHDAYKIGDEVSHKGVNYTSKINANTTEPGTDGTFHRWWEPAR